MKTGLNQMPVDDAPCEGEIETPLYLVSVRDGFTLRSDVMVQLSRMDGTPARDRRGDRLRQDRENFLTLPQAMQALRDIMAGLPTHTEAEAAFLQKRDLDRFYDEFNGEARPLDLKTGRML